MIKDVIKKLLRKFNFELRKIRRENISCPSRDEVARWYINGSGIEIGSLFQPLAVPSTARVLYVDRFPIEKLKKIYYHVKWLIERVDIVDNGETLKTIKNNSQDFVIANHFLEHCENPIGAILNMFRVLKKEGILFICVPDKRTSAYDGKRSLTSFDHLWKDYLEGPQISKAAHIHEWMDCNEFEIALDAETKKQHGQHYLNESGEIHYHVWTQENMMEFLLKLKALVSFQIEFFLQRGEEINFVLKKF